MSLTTINRTIYLHLISSRHQHFNLVINFPAPLSIQVHNNKLHLITKALIAIATILIVTRIINYLILGERNKSKKMMAYFRIEKYTKLKENETIIFFIFCLFVINNL